MYEFPFSNILTVNANLLFLRLRRLRIYTTENIAAIAKEAMYHHLSCSKRGYSCSILDKNNVSFLVNIATSEEKKKYIYRQ